jgi:heme/copper-type cytochrome/quinol oxidase subunit 2
MKGLKNIVLALGFIIFYPILLVTYPCVFCCIARDMDEKKYQIYHWLITNTPLTIINIAIAILSFNIGNEMYESHENLIYPDQPDLNKGLINVIFYIPLVYYGAHILSLIFVTVGECKGFYRAI